MLSESLQELLSAYVDGELAPAEYERVMAALRDSTIARDYVAELRSISGKLKSLPACQTPPEFTKKFLQDRKRVQLRKRNWQWSSAATIAASLFIAVAVWWFANRPGINTDPIRNQNDLAKNTNQLQTPQHNNLPVSPVRPSIDLAALTPMVQESLAVAFDQWDAWQDRFSGTIAWLTRADAIREGRFLEGQSTLLTGPVKNTGKLFKTLEAPLPLLLTPDEYQPAALQKRWAKKGLFVLDISSKDTILTMSRLTAAGKDAKLNLVIDDEVKQRLTKKLPATFMIYLENATEEQIISWLNTMQLADYWKQTDLKKDISCLSMILYPLDAAGRSQVSRSLGLPVDQLSNQNQSPFTTRAVALSYYSYRLPNTLSDATRQTISSLQGPGNDRLSLVVLIRSTQ